MNIENFGICHLYLGSKSDNPSLLLISVLMSLDLRVPAICLSN